MINDKKSIKRKLLVYNFFIHLLLLSIFSFSLFKALEVSSLDKIESSLKVILLDIVDDVIEHKDEITIRKFDEEKEYKFEPLYIRLFKLEDNLKVINSNNIPFKIEKIDKNIKYFKENIIYFEEKQEYIFSRIKFKIDKEYYVLEVSTSHKLVNDTLENLLYVLYFILPIILIFSTLGGYFILNKSFFPIENILNKLEKININNISSNRLDVDVEGEEFYLLTKKINELLHRIEISYERISQFSSDASHELKTPITIIRGEAEYAISKENEIDVYKNALKKIIKETEVIQKTVDDLLFLAKTEKVDELVNSEIYLDEVSIEACEELNDFAKLKDINLELDIKEPITFKGNKKLLIIALKNLIKNAISYSPTSSKVIIRNFVQNNTIILQVMDKGKGIDKIEQERIFDSFYRPEKSRNRDNGGTGLGLSICKKIVELHNASIRIDSEKNKGCIVSILINVDRDE